MRVVSGSLYHCFHFVVCFYQLQQIVPQLDSLPETKAAAVLLLLSLRAEHPPTFLNTFHVTHIISFVHVFPPHPIPLLTYLQYRNTATLQGVRTVLANVTGSRFRFVLISLNLKDEYFNLQYTKQANFSSCSL